MTETAGRESFDEIFPAYEDTTQEENLNEYFINDKDPCPTPFALLYWMGLAVFGYIVYKLSL